jgi:hypothetical protein
MLCLTRLGIYSQQDPQPRKLLYNLGLEAKQDFVSINGPVLQPPVGLVSPVTVAWPPLADATSAKTWECPRSLFVPLLLRVTEAPNVLVAAVACIHTLAKQLSRKDLASVVVTQYLIRPHDMEHIYMSPNPFGRLFKAALISETGTTPSTAQLASGSSLKAASSSLRP